MAGEAPPRKRRGGTGFQKAAACPGGQPLSHAGEELGPLSSHPLQLALLPRGQLSPGYKPEPLPGNAQVTAVPGLRHGLSVAPA